MYKRDVGILVLAVCAVYVALQSDGPISFHKAWCVLTGSEPDTRHSFFLLYHMYLSQVFEISSRGGKRNIKPPQSNIGAFPRFSCVVAFVLNAFIIMI